MSSTFIVVRTGPGQLMIDTRKHGSVNWSHTESKVLTFYLYNYRGSINLILLMYYIVVFYFIFTGPGIVLHINELIYLIILSRLL